MPGVPGVSRLQRCKTLERRIIFLGRRQSTLSVAWRRAHLRARARLVSAMARGHRWLDDVVSGRVTTVTHFALASSSRQVNMTISLAFLAPNLVRAAVRGRLPRGIGIERLHDPLNGVGSLRRSASICCSGPKIIPPGQLSERQPTSTAYSTRRWRSCTSGT